MHCDRVWSEISNCMPLTLQAGAMEGVSKHLQFWLNGEHSAVNIMFHTYFSES